MIIAAAVPFCWAVIAPGAASAEAVGPTVRLTSHIRVDRNHALEAVGFYGNRNAVDHRFVPSADSTDFRGMRLTGLDLIRTEISTPGHSMTTTWKVEFSGSVDHYDLTTEDIVFDHLPAGARLVSKAIRCFNGSPIHTSCT